MQLDAKQVRRALQRMGVEFLFHANTVTTSCTFLEQGALLSRRAVQIRKLAQTPQGSDAIDKRYKIWNDIFLDIVDIHARAGRRNLYGPILFVIDVRVLGSASVQSVWITKKNPTQWKAGEPKSNRFYASIDEFESDYNIGDFRSMLMLRDTEGELPLRSILNKIIIDKAEARFRVGDTVMYAHDYASNRLMACSKQSNRRRLDLEYRTCSACGCVDEYRRYPVRVKELFAHKDDKSVALHFG